MESHPPLKVARRGGVAPFIVMEILQLAHERAAAGGDVLHLEVGQPATPAPAPVRAAAARALETEVLGYTPALGLPALRARIARHYGDTHGVAVDPERVVATTGSSGGFVLAFLAAFDAGDRVALASPGYPAYRNILQALGVTVVDLPVDADTRFQPTPNLLAPHLPLDGLIVASPANPTGTMIDPGEMAALARFCRDHGVRLVSDEIYHGLTYERPAVTALAHAPDAVVVNSFSKTWSMTGWRLGWLVVPPDLQRSVECLTQNLFISPPSLSQHAALAAFDCAEDLAANLDRYRRNRDLLVAGLPGAGFPRLAPAEGAFYLYADIRDRGADSESLCRRMLAETGVAATPGIDFDPDRGRDFVRFSFAGSTEDMAEAVRRLGDWR